MLNDEQMDHVKQFGLVGCARNALNSAEKFEVWVDGHDNTVFDLFYTTVNMALMTTPIYNRIVGALRKFYGEVILLEIKELRKNPGKAPKPPNIKNIKVALNEEDVAKIKLALRANEAVKIISDRYNTSPGTIRRIRDNRTWKHVVI